MSNPLQKKLFLYGICFVILAVLSIFMIKSLAKVGILFMIIGLVMLKFAFKRR